MVVTLLIVNADKATMQHVVLHHDGLLKRLHIIGFLAVKMTHSLPIWYQQASSKSLASLNVYFYE